MAFIRAKRRNGRTYYSLVECRWAGKPVQKVITYLPTDSLNLVELRGTFGQQAQRFIGEYQQRLRVLVNEIAASKEYIQRSKSRPDSRFHRARIERLQAKAGQLKRCVAILNREMKASEKGVKDSRRKTETGH